MPFGTIFDLDVDATNSFFATAGQSKRLNVWSMRTGRTVRTYRPETMRNSNVDSVKSGAGDSDDGSELNKVRGRKCDPPGIEEMY